MVQQGQVFELNSTRGDGRTLWAYRYRTGGRSSKRVQSGGFASDQDARAALDRALEKQRLGQGSGRMLTLAELVEQYLDQHEASAVTLEKPRWLLTHAVAVFGERRLDELVPYEIAAWRMTIRPGYRFEATQALREVLQRAVVWGLLDVNPAKLGVENPQRRPTEKRPFESWNEVKTVAARLRGCLGPMVIFAAATGLRPGEWVALEQRDVDRESRVVYVRLSFGKGRLKCTKTETSVRAVPLQAIAFAALDELPAGGPSDLLFRGVNGGYLDLHNFRNRDWRPAQSAAGIDPFRRIYDLRHTFATLRAPCRHLDLRSFPLHGRQSGHDRPPLWSPRPRRTRARNPPARQLQHLRGGRSWTLGGH
jgi:integrase